MDIYYLHDNIFRKFDTNILLYTSLFAQETPKKKYKPMKISITARILKATARNI